MVTKQLVKLVGHKTDDAAFLLGNIYWLKKEYKKSLSMYLKYLEMHTQKDETRKIIAGRVQKLQELLRPELR